MKRRSVYTWENIAGIPAFVLACAISLLIFAGIQKLMPRAEGPGLLPVYLCCAVFPAFALVFGIGAAIKSLGNEDGPQLRITPIHLMILATIAILSCIAIASWPRPQTRQPGAPAPSDPTDPASRARALARKAVVQRLSESGVEGMQLDARQITRAGTPYWRVTTKGAISDYVVDVGEGTRPNAWGQPEPVVDVFEAGAAPLEDLNVEAPDATAPVSSQ